MKTDELISTLKQVEEITTASHTTSWVWGGLTADIYQGRILREHQDLDYLTLHLHELIEPLTHRFQNAGFQVRQLSMGDLKVEKEGIKIQLGHITFSQQICWTHNGELGSLFFPLNWLVQQLRRFCGVELHVVAPEFQYVLLAHPELLKPEWVPREKDIAAKMFLKTILEADGISVDDLRILIHA